MNSVRPGHPVRGVMLLGLLLTLAIGSLSLMLAVDVWAVARQRQLEQELLFVGEQYRLAIERYYHATPPGLPRALPASLKDLLEDDRYSIPVRHLRRLYSDPLTGEPQWGAVMQGLRIAGVYSLAKGLPLKQAGFPKNAEAFSGRASYRDWAFTFLPPKNTSVGRPARPGASDLIDPSPNR